MRESKHKKITDCMCLIFVLAAFAMGMAGCGFIGFSENGTDESPDVISSEGDTLHSDGTTLLPESLERIPEGYFSSAEREGQLVDLRYDTWESFSYDEKCQALNKRAVVYLPYGYSELKKYPVLYLMHGGWSDETVYLGSQESPARFKFVLDHAIQDGLVEPMIVVCPTYNNTSESDSGDYDLAIRLTDNYHNELVNDLIPAVEDTYSTYAESTDAEGISMSRGYRAFMGFSMGSVATWRTFEHSLDYFRYFFPSSGNLGVSGSAMADMVRSQDKSPEEFFIFAATGTDDFAYSGFKAQIDAMANVNDGSFVSSRDEHEGNLWYLEQEGGTHNGEYAMQYFYNGVRWLWR